MVLTLGCVTAAFNSAFKSVFPSSTTGTALVLVLGIGSGRDASEPVNVVSGPTAVLFSLLPLASPAQQKQLDTHVHPACFAGQVCCEMIYHALSVANVPLHHLLMCMTTCIACDTCLSACCEEELLEQGCANSCKMTPPGRCWRTASSAYEEQT